MIVWLIIESLIKGYLYWTFRNVKTGVEEAVNSIMQFFPLESMANLIKEPFTRLGAVKSVANQIGENFTKDYSVSLFNIAIVLIWTAIFIYSSYALLKKRDL